MHIVYNKFCNFFFLLLFNQEFNFPCAQGGCCFCVALRIYIHTFFIVSSLCKIHFFLCIWRFNMHVKWENSNKLDVTKLKRVVRCYWTGQMRCIRVVYANRLCCGAKKKKKYCCAFRCASNIYRKDFFYLIKTIITNTLCIYILEI